MVRIIDRELKLNYLPVSILQPNTANRCSNPLDANWAAHFLFGRWAWDGYLFGARQEGPNLDLIDDTYAYGFDRIGESLPLYLFGGYPNCLYSSAYNPGYGSAGLRGTEWRDTGIRAYQASIRYSMSSPYGWWESSLYPAASSPWDRPHSPNGQGSCQHMWGQSVANKVLVDSLIAETGNRDLIIGRGVPSDWLQDGQSYSVENMPISAGKRFGYALSVSGKTITITFSGDKPDGNYFIDLPDAIGNIDSVSAGSFDNASGRVTLANTATGVSITLQSTPNFTRDLEKAIRNAAEYDPYDYTVVSYGRLNAAVAEANALLAGDASQAVIDAVIAKIQQAIEDLVPMVGYDNILDYTAGARNGNWAFGAVSGGDQMYRFQTFTPAKSGALEMVSVMVMRSGTPNSDMLAELYLTDSNGFPTGSVLASTTVSRDLVGASDTVVTFSMDYSVTADVQYALALRQVTGHNSNRYQWITYTPRLTPEHFGKTSGSANAWSFEDGLGTGWMRIETEDYDKHDLQDLVLEALTLIDSTSAQYLYTTVSWNALLAALPAAQTELENRDTDSAALDPVFADLKAALDGLDRITINLAAGQAPSFVIRKNMITQIKLITNAESLTFTSSNSAIATVTQTGVVTGKSIGVAVIQIKDLRSGVVFNVVVNCTN